MKEMAEFGKEREYEYKFSIIMAVYNVESFIEEAIDSLIQQDFGFEYHVQLILVDDGSTDRSGAICDEYQKRYPGNIEVIHQQNDGVSSARNVGIPLAKGKYVNFMDPDDKLSLNTLKEVFIFFEKHYDEIDVAVIPLVFFEGRKGEHPTNAEIFKKGSRVVDLMEEYKCVIVNFSRFFLKNSELEHWEFDKQYQEDSHNIFQIFLHHQKIGAISNCRYEFRIYSTRDKKIFPTEQDLIHYHKIYIEDFLIPWMKDLFYRKSEIPRYFQNTISYLLMEKYQFLAKSSESMEDTTFEEYKNLFRLALHYIEDKVIIEEKNFFTEFRLGLINLKYGNESSIVPIKNDVMFYRNLELISYLSSVYTRIDFIKYKNNTLSIEGRMMSYNCNLEEDISIFVIINEVEIECQQIPLNEHKYAMNEIIYRSIGFSVEIDIDSNVERNNITFSQNYRGFTVRKKEIRFGKFSPIGKEFRSSYYHKDGYVLTVKDATLHFDKGGIKSHINHEKKFLKEIKAKYPQDVRKIAIARAMAKISNKLSKKQIWLLSDSVSRADDNGKALYSFLSKKKLSKIKVYFLIDKNSPDYKKLRKIGKVVNYHSLKKKSLFLQASRIISSASGEYVINPFSKHFYFYRDLLQTQKYVFLQHGITKDDMSHVLNKYNKNISLLVSAVNAEYESFMSHDYYYKSEEIILSGFPRFDLLYNNSKKYITIMPTWRKYLTTLDRVSGEWKINENFRNSTYFSFYNMLINSEVLITSAKHMGYHIQFVPHPILAPHIYLFQKHPDVEFVCFDKPYRKIYAESDLMINDYSSASFDFSYLRKPVIYTHFDKDVFFSGGHSYTQGYFDYETMGFGEVEYDLESTVNRIIEYMENGCQLKDKFRERIDNFFAFHDQNNCQRVYEAVLDLDSK